MNNHRLIWASALPAALHLYVVRNFVLAFGIFFATFFLSIVRYRVSEVNRAVPLQVRPFTDTACTKNLALRELRSRLNKLTRENLEISLPKFQAQLGTGDLEGEFLGLVFESAKMHPELCCVLYGLLRKLRVGDCAISAQTRKTWAEVQSCVERGFPDEEKAMFRRDSMIAFFACMAGEMSSVCELISECDCVSVQAKFALECTKRQSRKWCQLNLRGLITSFKKVNGGRERFLVNEVHRILLT